MPLDHNAILKSVRSGFKTYLDGGGTALPNEDATAWLNHRFDPPNNNSLWMSEHFTVISERRSANALLEFDGIVEYRLSVRSGRGTALVHAAAVVMKGLYEAGTTLTVDGVSVLIYRAEQLAGRQLEEWYKVPVRLFVRSFATTTN